MIKKIYFFLYLLLVTFFQKSHGQEFGISSRSEKIEIVNDSSFVNHITIHFKKYNSSSIYPTYSLYPIYYDSELEEISGIKIYQKKKKKLKELELGYIKEEKINLDFIASRKSKSVKLPSDKEIVLKYSVTCNELMYFSSLQFFSYNQIDTLKYEINVPKKFNLTHKSSHLDSLTFFSIDSFNYKTHSQWKIKTVPKKIEPNPFRIFGIYKNINAPLIRTLVYPKDLGISSGEYMNKWYFKNNSTKRKLSATAKQKIDQLTENITDEREIIRILYNYIRKNFKYVAIEIGIGAFIPTSAEKVFKDKQGDCKDLSNLLSNALNYKGIESTVALASTFDHINDCDFPSLSSANHVICVAYVNNKKIFLDPTDSFHKMETPVQSLQNRTVFIIDSDKGEFVKIDSFSSEQNKIVYKFDLNLDSEKASIIGNFKASYHGLSENYLKRYESDFSKEEVNQFRTIFFKEILGNQKVSNVTKHETKTQLDYNGSIDIDGKTFNDEFNTYLFLDFLPILIETENRDKLIEGTYLENNFKKIVYLDITLKKPVKEFQLLEKKIEEKNTFLNLEVKFISDHKVKCKYVFDINYIHVDNNNVRQINNVLNFFKKITNEPIVFQNKEE